MSIGSAARSGLSTAGRTPADIEVNPLAGSLGAEVVGVDLANLDDEAFAVIHRAMLDNLVIVIRGQDITADEQVAFARRFGEPWEFPHGAGIEGNRFVLPIYRLKGGLGRGRWHSDATFAERPPAISMLAAKELPSKGGETGFANMYLAYETLSDGMRRMIDGLQAFHDATSHGKPEDNAVHPVVRTHPETGRKALFVNSEFTRRFDDMTVSESRGLLGYLTEQATRPELCFFHRWLPGDVTIWDNRAVQHYPVVDTPVDEVRRMWRVTVSGDRPS